MKIILRLFGILFCAVLSIAVLQCSGAGADGGGSMYGYPPGATPAPTPSPTPTPSPSPTPTLNPGTTYYVATTGSNSNPGTIASPFLTIQKGVDTVSAGGTVVVEDGSYTDSTTAFGGACSPASACYVAFLTTSGTSGNPITIQAQHAGAATITGNNATGVCFALNTSTDYVNIIGFNMTACVADGIVANGGNNHDIFISQNTISHIGEVMSCSLDGYAGVYSGHGNYNITITRNQFSDVGRLPDASCPELNYTNDHEVYAYGYNNTISSNLFWDAHSGWAIQAGSGASPEGAGWLIANNTFAPGPNPNPSAYGNIVTYLPDGASDATITGTIENNLTYSPTTVFLDLYGSGSTGTGGNWTLTNNLISNGAALTGNGTCVSPTTCANSGNLLNQNPLLYNPTGNPPGLQITTGSPAYQAGVYNASIPQFDFLGNGLHNPPSIGAYDGTIPPIPTGCVTEPTLTPGVEYAANFTPFCGTSVWNVPVPTNCASLVSTPCIASYSTTLTGHVWAGGNNCADCGVDAGYNNGNLYYATTSDPKVNLTCNSYCPSGSEKVPTQMYIPAVARPAQGCAPPPYQDQTMQVRQPDDSLIEIAYTGGPSGSCGSGAGGNWAPNDNLTGAMGNCGAFGSSGSIGFFTTAVVVSASGRCFSAGVLRAVELTAGMINHALSITPECNGQPGGTTWQYPAVSGASVPGAACSNGTSYGPQLGAHEWWNESCTTMSALYNAAGGSAGLTASEVAIFCAEYNYGLYVTDNVQDQNDTARGYGEFTGDNDFMFGQYSKPNPYNSLPDWSSYVNGTTGVTIHYLASHNDSNGNWDPFGHGPSIGGHTNHVGTGDALDPIAHAKWLNDCAAKGTCS